MQRVTLVRYAAKPGRADENERLSRAVFEELRAKRPGGIAYALFRAGDEFTHVFINFEEDSSEQLTGLASFEAFSRGGPDRYVAAPDVIRMGVEVVESYGFGSAMAAA